MLQPVFLHILLAVQPVPQFTKVQAPTPGLSRAPSQGQGLPTSQDATLSFQKFKQKQDMWQLCGKGGAYFFHLYPSKNNSNLKTEVSNQFS